MAVDRIAMGVARKNMFVSDKDKLTTAYHEVIINNIVKSGHTIVALLTKAAIPLHKVTILPRGSALGFVIQLTIIYRHQCYLKLIC